MHISNLYKDSTILLFKECYALEKIHGTSAHLSWKEGNLSFFGGGAGHEPFSKLFDAEALTEKLRAKIGAPQSLTIYGEAYGGKMQRMKDVYGDVLRFVVFEAKINDTFLAVPNAEGLSQSLGLEFVYYQRIPAEIEALNAARDADSMQAIRNGMGTGRKGEGSVVRPLLEFTHSNGTRIIAKHKRAEFRETKSPRVDIDPARLTVLSDAQTVAEEWVTAMRLSHITDKLTAAGVSLSMTATGKVIEAMLEDVLREGAGEIVDSREVRKAISQKASVLYRESLSLQAV